MRPAQSFYCYAMMATILSCSSSSFQGADKAPAQPAKQEEKAAAKNVTPPKPSPSPSPTEAIDEAVDEDRDVVPDGIVDGQEVIDNCERCVARAQQLSPQAGFAATKDITVNLGFYKIEPSRNLCDVHFLADFSIPIDDHSGEDTIGNSQIILYCPCDCGWARDNNDPFGGLGSIIDAFGGGGW